MGTAVQHVSSNVENPVTRCRNRTRNSRTPIYCFCSVKQKFNQVPNKKVQMLFLGYSKSKNIYTIRTPTISMHLITPMNLPWIISLFCLFNSPLSLSITCAKHLSKLFRPNPELHGHCSWIKRREGEHYPAFRITISSTHFEHWVYWGAWNYDIICPRNETVRHDNTTNDRK